MHRLTWRGVSRWGWAVALVVMLLGLVGCGAPSEASRQAVYVIQPGSSARAAAGEKVTMLPSPITLNLGKTDVLVIQNDDSEPVTIEGIKLAPGQRATQRFYSPGTFELVCAGAGHAETVRIIVEPASK